MANKTANTTANTTEKKAVKTAPRNISLNRIELTGRLVSDMESRVLENGRIMAVGRVAVHKTINGNEYTRFIDIKMFSDEPVEYKKGEQVYIQGRLVKDSWQTESGEYRARIRILAFNIIPTQISGNDFNYVTVSGRLVEDPKPYSLSKDSGRMVLRLRMAVNRAYKQGEEWIEDTTYLDVAHFGTAQYIAKLSARLKKGMFVYVHGELYQDNYQDNIEKETVKRERMYILAENINISAVAPKKNKDGETTETEKEENKAKQRTETKKEKTVESVEEDITLEIPEDVPF